MRVWAAGGSFADGTEPRAELTARRQHQQMAPPDEGDAVPPSPDESTDEINRFAEDKSKNLRGCGLAALSLA